MSLAIGAKVSKKSSPSSWVNPLATVLNRRNGQGPNHLKFFLLVFAKDEAQAQSPSPRRPSPRKPTPIKESLGAWLDLWEEIAK